MATPQEVRLLIALDGSEASRRAVESLTGLEGVRRDSYPSFEAAIRSCNDPGPPDIVLTLADQQAPGFLELMVAIDHSSRGVPLIVLTERESGIDLPIESGRSFILLPVTRASEELPTLVKSTLAGEFGNAEGRRRGADFLLASILGRRSVALDLCVRSGVEVHFEIVGGDVWNAYSGDLKAIDALEAVLYEPVTKVITRALQTIPGERLIEIPGLQAVGPATRRLLLRGREEPDPGFAKRDLGTQEVSSGWKRDLRTQEIELGSVAAILAEARATRNAPMPSVVKRDAPQPRVEPLRDSAKFDALLAEGIQAALARNYARAVDAFEHALVLRPGDTKAEFNLARVRQRLKG